MRLVRKPALFDFADVTANRRLNAGLALHKILRELWFFAYGNIQQVMQDQDLTVDTNTGAYANHRYFQGCGNLGGQICWHAFE